MIRDQIRIRIQRNSDQNSEDDSGSSSESDSSSTSESSSSRSSYSTVSEECPELLSIVIKAKRKRRKSNMDAKSYIVSIIITQTTEEHMKQTCLFLEEDRSLKEDDSILLSVTDREDVIWSHVGMCANTVSPVLVETGRGTKSDLIRRKDIPTWAHKNKPIEYSFEY